MLHQTRCVVHVNRRERKFGILCHGSGPRLPRFSSPMPRCWSAQTIRFSPHALDAVILAFIAIIAEEMAVEVRDRVTVTAGNLPILLAIMFLGQLPAMAVAVVVGLWGAWRETSRAVATYNCANLVISAFVAGGVFSLLQRHLSIPLNTVTPSLLVAGGVAAMLYEGTNNVLTSLGAWVKYGIPPATYWRGDMPSQLFQSLAVVVGLGLAVAALYATAGITAVVLLFIPLFASQYMFKLLVRERAHVAKQKDLTDKYLEMNLGLAVAMVVLLDSKDEYTADHSAAVAMYCRDMALAAGMDENEAEEIHLAGLLHDLGKVGTPDAILRKDSSLDENEWGYIRQHPEKGAEVLSHLAAYQNVADIVRYHHERLDGSGYPGGLTGRVDPRRQQDAGRGRHLSRHDLGPPVSAGTELVRGSQGAPHHGRRAARRALGRDSRRHPARQGPRLPGRQRDRLHGRVRARSPQPPSPRRRRWPTSAGLERAHEDPAAG